MGGFEVQFCVLCSGSMQAGGPHGSDSPTFHCVSVGSLGRPHTVAFVKVPAQQTTPLHLAVAGSVYAAADGAAAVVGFAAGHAQLAANKTAHSRARPRARSKLPWVGVHSRCFCSVEI